ncbi:helix-turn-helix domain-containing protein [Streptomyces sp. CB02261]|uniref:helix-turn-helix domain-containing protein n=1 Tax=Streptomyces sp. CB02261 TaxID=1703940 RepID=UPI00093FE61F|nr:helix-turn-helix transcriptional regulator [Streptomyces sp. CB02261]
MTPGEHAPEPRGAGTPAEFLARLQALKDWSGLTYRELTARAEEHGDVLPRSTVANMLARPTLPREELLLSFVRACGVAPAALEDWRTVRRDLARRGPHAPAIAPAAPSASPQGSLPDGAGGPLEDPAPSRHIPSVDPGPSRHIPDPGPSRHTTDASVDPVPSRHTPEASGDPVEDSAPRPRPRDPSGDPPEDGAPPRHLPGPSAGPSEDPVPPPSWPGDPGPPGGRPGMSSRIRRALVAAVAVAGLVLAGVSVVAVLRDGGTGPAGQPPRTPAAPTTPSAPGAGDVRIRVAGTEFCLGERRGVRSGQVHQLPCAEAGFPRYSLAAVAAGRWRIVSHHPDFGPGCSGIPSGGRVPDAAYEDSECGDPSRVEVFALEPYGSPVRGHRIVPVGSATPGSCVTVVGDRTAAWARLAQAPCAPDATGQLFTFERAP